jgi:sugar O-acyltransferase (sialic acid O-acetyltransferase NeuD family)
VAVTERQAGPVPDVADDNVEQGRLPRVPHRAVSETTEHLSIATALAATRAACARKPLPSPGELTGAAASCAPRRVLAMNTERIVIVGAGGFGREVLDVVEAINFECGTTERSRYEVLGFLDDGDPDPRTLAPYGVDVIGGVGRLAELPEDVGYVIAIGSPAVRRKLDEQGQRPCPVLVHPAATYGRAVTFGPGTVVCAGVRLTNNIAVGRHVHANLNATVGHDAVLGDYVTLSPLVAVSGNVTLEDDVMVGTGVTINPGVTVGRGAVLGSGGAVLRDVAAGMTAVGVPAKPR